MDRQTKRRRAVELAKDVVIVALACSALFLASQIQPFRNLGGTAQSDTTANTIQTPEGARADAIRPLRLVANLAGEGTPVRYGVQYDTAQSDQIFQQVASLLAEALSSAGEPERMSRGQWEKVLSETPGIAFDFQGNIPMVVLVGWLSGESTQLEATVRRVVLTTYEDQVAVCYQDVTTGEYFRCLSGMANQFHLTETLGALGENGAHYAFEVESYEMLDPDTLISETTPVPAIYTASNPVSGGQEDLKEIMEALGLSVENSSFYPSVDGQVARVGSDTLRLYDQGTVEYQTGEEGESAFQVSSRSQESLVFESVELCRKLTAAVLGGRCGEARFFLSEVQQTDEGLRVSFQYCLNGSVVQMERGSAAQFVLKDGQIQSFYLVLRSYANSGRTSVVMPFRQAAAALEAEGLEGKELLLMYTDTGADTVTASWMAADHAWEEE